MQPDKLKLLTRIIESSPVGIIITDCRGWIRIANERAKNIFGLTKTRVSKNTTDDPESFITSYLSKPFHENNLPFRVVLKTRRAIYGVERTIDAPDGRKVILSINSAPLFDETGQLEGIIATIEDITDRKLAEKDRENLVKELTSQSKQMEELNSALHALVDQREKDKEEFEKKIMSNLNSSVFPYLEKLDNTRLSGEQKVFLEIAFSNLTNIFSSFSSTLAAKFTMFTPRELQVATLVRQGRVNKDIADLLNLSVRSVESHRRSIRRKLGLTGKNLNLRSYLASLR